MRNNAETLLRNQLTRDTVNTVCLVLDAQESSLKSTDELLLTSSEHHHLLLCLSNALLRIENKTYGIDRITGELIPKERLRIVPHATLSVESKNARKK